MAERHCLQVRGKDLFRRLLPNTRRWAALQAARESARRTDGDDRGRAHDLDGFVSLLAEQAFATELQRLTAHLAERLTGRHDGQPKVLRDSAVANLREFFDRFRRLNIRSSPELDELVAHVQQVIEGVQPQTLRDSNRLRQMVARDLRRVGAGAGTGGDA